MITKSETLIKMIAGPIRNDVRPLAYSVNTACNLLFEQKIPWDEIRITKDIYPIVAKQLSKKPTTIARSVERMVNRCWNQMTPADKIYYLGRNLDDITSTTDFIVYLAYYLYYQKPYFEVLQLQFTTK